MSSYNDEKVYIIDISSLDLSRKSSKLKQYLVL